MGRKYIKKVLTNKWKAWVDEIKDEKIKELVKENSYITGGAIVSLLQGEQPNDLDIYFKNQETVVAVAKYYADMWNEDNDYKFSVRVDEDGRVRAYVPSKGILEEGKEDDKDFWSLVKGLEPTEKKKDKKKKYRPIFVSSNAITLSDDIQVIIRFYGTPEEVHKNFDFVHCTNYFVPATGELSLNRDALESIIFKELRYIGSRYPMASIFRAKKFLKRGWNINAGQYLKMAMQLQNFDLSDPEVLEDQLTGVDYFYFQEIIQRLRIEQENNPDFKVDATYLGKVIDKVFDEED